MYFSTAHRSVANHTLLAVFMSFFLITQATTASAYPGCIDPVACNFDPGATIDDGSCLYGNCELLAVPDEICVEEGDPINYNVLSNDLISQGFYVQVQIILETPCFFIDGEGNIQEGFFAEDCCGEHVLEYMVCTSDGIMCSEPTTVTITVKCDKPDCSLINLEDFDTADDPTGGGNPGDGGCASVCENSVVTFYVPYNANDTYSWTVVGGSGVTGANDAEHLVTWGAAGSGLVSVTITDATGFARTITVCVDILPGPTASFTTPGYACLGQPMCFTNTSIMADAYDWDFGDGNYSTMEHPCHTYTAPGTYIVTLTATKFNYDDQGNPLCCCVDVFSFEVTVDDLPGPNIFWVSTLCEGDMTCYWTDATNCTSYLWTVTDADGNTIIPDSGQGTDEICVTWGAGPYGTVTLDVDGCDQAYCDNPTSVTVPIISAVGEIDGPTEVCEHSTHTYCLPKWVSTTYDWDVTGGMILGSDSSHCVTVMWDVAGEGTLTADYWSDFLAGLPNHDGSQCYGSATLDVVIKPEFSLINFNGSPVCTNTVSTIQATSLPSPNYTWTITPPVSFTGQGTDVINVTWDGGPGVFIIDAVPNDPTVYCNDIESVIVIVAELGPPDAIIGATEICPGDTYVYTGVTSDTGVTLFWSATNGTLAPTIGENVNVTWGPTGPYTLTLTQQMAGPPFCVSDPIQITVNPKEIQGPLLVTGSAACTNLTGSFTLTPTQHADANIWWEIDDPDLGSVTSGQGTHNIGVQWNNDSGPVDVIVTVALCGDTAQYTWSGTLIDPIYPNIVQTGYLCPGGTAGLDAGPGFSPYLWSTGSTSQTTSISSPGIYWVTTTDTNGCVVTTYFEANETALPTASISSGDPLTICWNDPHAVTITAQTNTNLVFEWFCDGVSQGLPSPVSTFTHPNTGADGTFNYWVVVTDTVTMCENTSDTITVVETFCDGPPMPCTPINMPTLTPLANNQFPNCNNIDFSFSATNFNFTQWSFGDLSTSGSPSPTHTYTTAGYYYVVVSGTTPAQGGGTCPVSADTTVCVPLAAEFDINYLGCDTVKFTDFSTWIDGPGNAVNSVLWTFDTFGTSTDPCPTFVFPSGTWPVTLTVTNANGCQATIVHNVTISSVTTPTLTAATAPYCVGDPILFSSVAPGAVNWFWDFGDGATFNGATPSHTYVDPGPFTITLTVTSADGCTASNTLNITVHPAIPPDVITGPDVICQGDLATLTAPAGYSYMWSNGMTTQIIMVPGGTYSVVLTDGNGCTLQLDDHTVTEVPPPPAIISGNHYICDTDCNNLFASSGFGYTYQWYENGGSIIPTAVSPVLVVCSGGINSPYEVEVTDAYGCTTLSDPFDVFQAFSPVFNIDIAPDTCAGTPTTLTINPIDPDVTYNWSTGESGTSIVVIQAGTYTVVGTHNITGCSSSQSATIYPQPDLCAVPVGCYEVCDPDTVCGPLGLASYQWHYNGAPLTGATDPCVELTMSGSYSLTATNDFGCSTTSDSLYIEVIPCDSASCDSLWLDWTYHINEDQTFDSCCVMLTYTNLWSGDLQGLMISTSDADINVDLGSIDPALQIQSIGSNNVSLISNPSGNPIPSGALPNFIDLCLENVINDPQYLIIDWFDFDDEIVCSDTIEFTCPIEPDCLYMVQDSIYCEDGLTIYDFTVCNPNDALFPVGFIQLTPSSPGGVILTPPNFDLTTSPIAPGDCQNFSVQLSGTGIANQLFCYDILAHEFNPDSVPGSLCCALDTTYCILIPPCDPCEEVFVENVDQFDPLDCCYDIFLANYYDPNFFDEIALCILSDQTTMTVNNPFGSGWTTSGYTGTEVSFLPEAVFNNFVPGGIFGLPNICIETNVAPNQQIEIKWMQAGDIVCRDTIEVFCEPPCGYFVDESTLCDPATGTWNFSGVLKNTSTYTISEAHVHFTDPSLSIYDQIVLTGPVAPGATYSSINLNIGPPAQPGDTVCFVVTLHEIDANGNYLSCCNFEHCIVLPPCDGSVGCHCDEEWFDAVNAGILCSADIGNPGTITFSWANPIFQLDCDEVKWKFGDGTGAVITYGSNPVAHSFPASGVYTVCLKITRYADDGSICHEKICKTIDVFIPAPPTVEIYPNPTTGVFKAKLFVESDEPILVTVLDHMHRPLIQARIEELYPVPTIELDLGGQAKGMYLIRFDFGDRVVVDKLILQ